MTNKIWAVWDISPINPALSIEKFGDNWISKDGAVITSQTRAWSVIMARSCKTWEVREYDGTRPTIDIMRLPSWKEVIARESNT